MIFALAACAPHGAFTWEEEQLLAPLQLPHQRPDLSGVLPEADPYDPEALFVLGKLLYTEPALSVPAEGAEPVSCGSCHDLQSGTDDPRGTPTSQGAGDHPTGRNASSVLNVAHWDAWGWCGQEPTLFEMVSFPFESDKAMNVLDNTSATQAVIVADYENPYKTAFGAAPSQATADDVYRGVILALATYVSQIVSAPSDLDRWLDGQIDALPEEQVPGAKLFVGRAGCVHCHNGPLLSDQQLHNIGLSSPPDDKCTDNAFRTPSLRGAATTEPYMHDGSIETLDGADGVLWHYAKGGGPVGAGEEDVRTVAPLDLSDQDLADLALFVSSLQGWDPEAADAWWSAPIGDVRITKLETK